MPFAGAAFSRDQVGGAAKAGVQGEGCKPCAAAAPGGSTASSSILHEASYDLEYGERGARVAFVASEPITGARGRGVAGMAFANERWPAATLTHRLPTEALQSHQPGRAHSSAVQQHQERATQRLVLLLSLRACVGAASNADWVAVPKNMALVITREKGGYINILRTPLLGFTQAVHLGLAPAPPHAPNGEHAHALALALAAPGGGAQDAGFQPCVTMLPGPGVALSKQAMGAHAAAAAASSWAGAFCSPRCGAVRRPLRGPWQAGAFPSRAATVVCFAGRPAQRPRWPSASKPSAAASPPRADLGCPRRRRHRCASSPLKPRLVAEPPPPPA